MHKRITFRNMDHVAAIENYANDKLAKLEKLLEHEPTPVYVDLILEPSKVHEHHRVELRVKSPHYDLISNYEGPEFYKILDRVVDVMLQELTREKRKQIDERNHRIKVSKLWEFQEKAADADEDEFEFEDELEDEDDEDDEELDIEFEFDEDA